MNNTFVAFAWEDWKQVAGGKWSSPGGRVLSDPVFQRLKSRGGKKAPSRSPAAKPTPGARRPAAPTPTQKPSAASTMEAILAKNPGISDAQLKTEAAKVMGLPTEEPRPSIVPKLDTSLLRSDIKAVGAAALRFDRFAGGSIASAMHQLGNLTSAAADTVVGRAVGRVAQAVDRNVLFGAGRASGHRSIDKLRSVQHYFRMGAVKGGWAAFRRFVFPYFRASFKANRRRFGIGGALGIETGTILLDLLLRKATPIIGGVVGAQLGGPAGAVIGAGAGALILKTLNAGVQAATGQSGGIARTVARKAAKKIAHGSHKRAGKVSDVRARRRQKVKLAETTLDETGLLEAVRRQWAGLNAVNGGDLPAPTDDQIRTALLAGSDMIARRLPAEAEPVTEKFNEVMTFAWADWKSQGGKWISPGGRVLSDAVYQRLKGRGAKTPVRPEPPLTGGARRAAASVSGTSLGQQLAAVVTKAMAAVRDGQKVTGKGAGGAPNYHTPKLDRREIDPLLDQINRLPKDELVNVLLAGTSNQFPGTMRGYFSRKSQADLRSILRKQIDDRYGSLVRSVL